jgi:hypothetical protein
MENSDRLQLLYSNVLSALKSVDEFRGKLLTLLPLASGAGGIVLLTEKVDPTLFLPVAVFGFVITVSLAMYEQRNLKLCNDLIDMGMTLEGEILNENKPTLRLFAAWKQRWEVEAASVAIFVAVMLAWIVMAVVGLATLESTYLTDARLMDRGSE